MVRVTIPVYLECELVFNFGKLKSPSIVLLHIAPSRMLAKVHIKFQNLCLFTQFICYNYVDVFDKLLHRYRT